MSGFEWDEVKSETNRRTHGVSFEEAKSVADSPLAEWAADVTHSSTEERARIVGWSLEGRLLVVIVSATGPPPRIISARRATKRERHAYEARP